MTDQFNTGSFQPERARPGPSFEYQTDEGDFEGRAKILLDDAKVVQELARQDGVLKGFQGSLSSIQGSVSAVQGHLGAWLTVVGVVTTVLIGFAVFNLTRTNTVGDRIDGLGQRLGGVEITVAKMENQLEALPEQVARELRAPERAEETKR